MKKLCFQKDFMTPGKEGRERPLRRERKNLCRLSRNVLLPGLSLCLVLFTQGCSLALEELPSRQDRLAGLYVTEHYISSGMPDLEINSRGEITAKSSEPEKIYGSFTDCDNGQNSSVSFPDLEGFGIYNLKLPEDNTGQIAGYTVCDPVFADLHYTVSHEEDSVEAALYVTAGTSQNYYFHPVYQQEDGRIYLVPGSGISTDSFVPGQQFGHSVSESSVIRENGKEIVQGYRFTVNIVASTLPVHTELLLLDADDQVMSRLSGEELEQHFRAGTALELPESVSYLILKQDMPGNEPGSHLLFDQNAEYLEYKISAGDNYLSPRQLPLSWPQTDGTD